MKKILGLLFVLILSFWTVKPLFGQGYFPIHDDTQVERVVVMGRALRQGQFPVRWVSDLGYGYGYPIFNFYGPLPYYIGGAFYAMGFSGLVATKLMMGLGLVLAGVAMYLALADAIGIAGAVLGAALYMFAPYHAVEVYVRGAVGEYWSLVFLPLIVWGFFRILQSKGARPGILLGAIGLAGLILSHTILGYAGMIFVAIALVVACIAVWKKYIDREQWKKLFFLVCLGLGLSAFFWLPALAEMKYTNVSGQISATADFRDHFVCPAQLWESLWGFGGSAKGCLDGMSFKVGKVQVLIALVATFGLIVGLIRSKAGSMLAAAGLMISAAGLFFTLPVSERVWETLPLFAYVQYPWRFLAFVIFGISLVAAQAAGMFRWQAVQWVGVAVCIALLLWVEAKRFMPQYTYAPAPSEFESETDIRYRASKISDEYLPPAVGRPANQTEIARDTITRSDLYRAQIRRKSDTYVQIGFFAEKETTVRVNIANFPGWHYFVNGRDTIAPLENGLPVLTIPEGNSTVELIFRNTPMRTVGNVLSLISLGICIYLYDRRKKINA